MADLACRAIILAAGRGSRLGDFTDEKPKCLLRLAGRSLLEWIIASLRQNNIDRIGVVRGYLREEIQQKNLHYFDNHHWKDTNMVASLCSARSWLLSGPCIVSYADILYHPEVVASLLNCRADIALVYDRLWRDLWQDRFDDPREDAESFNIRQGYLTRIGDKGVCLDLIQGQFLGLLKFTPTGWRQIEQLLSTLDKSTFFQLETTCLIQMVINSGREVRAVGVSGRWCEIDSDTDLQLYEKKINSNEAWAHDWRF